VEGLTWVGRLTSISPCSLRAIPNFYLQAIERFSETRRSTVRNGRVVQTKAVRCLTGNGESDHLDGKRNVRDRGKWLLRKYTIFSRGRLVKRKQMPGKARPRRGVRPLPQKGKQYELFILEKGSTGIQTLQGQETSGFRRCEEFEIGTGSTTVFKLGTLQVSAFVRWATGHF